MRVLIACEFSGIVRDAFKSRGHDAWSCDIIPSIRDGNHIQDNVLNNVLNNNWDLMIAHPPCTHLCSSGARWFAVKSDLQQDALLFVNQLLNCDIPKICIENPIGIISTKIRKPDQIIQPWMFGHPESKATCLWLKNIPKLKPTNVLEKKLKYWENQTPSGQNKLSSSRSQLRSITYHGIAAAMADQWG